MSRLTGRLERVEKQLRGGEQLVDYTGESQRFGELVSDAPHGRTYRRVEDGMLISTFVVAGFGTAYELVGVDMELLT